MSDIILNPDKGLGIPIKTTANKDAITSPATGSLVYDSDQGVINQYTGSVWQGVLTTAGVPASAMPAGSVIQVIQTAITAGFSTTSGSAVDITGLTATITPSSSANKILVITNFFANGASSPYPKFLLKRNGTTVFIGDAVGSSTRQSAGMVTGGSTTLEIISVATTYLDAPATTAAVTYQWQVSTFSSRAVYVGRSSTSANSNDSSTPSTITLMEVVA